MTKLEPARWTFVTVEGVEPTNTAAERAVRPAGLRRTGCFGADSDAGNTCVAKILTASATCRQQKRNVLDYLSACFEAHRRAQKVPSLVPAN